MIGRAAQGRPWIFREIAHFLATGEHLPPPDGRGGARADPRAPRRPLRVLRRGRPACAPRASTSAGTRATLRGGGESRARFQHGGDDAAQIAAVLRFFDGSPSGDDAPARRGAAGAATARGATAGRRNAMGRGGPRRVKRKTASTAATRSAAASSARSTNISASSTASAAPASTTWSSATSSARCSRRDGARRTATRRRPPTCWASTATRCARSSPNTSCCSRPMAAAGRSTALLSVSDKRGARRIRARRLHERGVALLSTGGTARRRSPTRACRSPTSARYTGFPEMLDGRVKTLHPRSTAASSRGATSPAHATRCAQHGIPTIDLVVVNLYPFRETVAKPGVTLEEAIENIDIGGPAMVRSAAKNWAHVGDRRRSRRLCARCSPSSRATARRSADATRFALDAQGVRAHGRLRRRDRQLADGARSATAPARELSRRRSATPASWCRTLRYGENPHQRGGVLSRRVAGARARIATYRQLQGKELSYNNIADADAAWECVEHVRRAGVRDRQAREPVRRGDRRDAARGVPQGVRDRSDVGVRRHHRVQPAGRRGDASRRSPTQFLEVLIAPAYTDEALGGDRAEEERARARDPARPRRGARTPLDFKRVGGGLLVQTPTTRNVALTELKVVTRRRADAAQVDDLHVRLARREVREVERDRVLRATGRRSASARAR